MKKDYVFFSSSFLLQIKYRINPIKKLFSLLSNLNTLKILLSDLKIKADYLFRKRKLYPTNKHCDALQKIFNNPALSTFVTMSRLS